MAFLGIGAKKKLTPEEAAAHQQQVAQSLYLGVDPYVDKAYKSDPRSLIANGLMATGSDTSALKGGMTEGLARVASGLAGGYIGGQQREKYRLGDAEQSGAFNTSLRKPVDAAVTPQDPAADPFMSGLADPNSALGQVASSLGPQQPAPVQQPQQGAQPAFALSPNFTQTGRATASPQQTGITPSPQLTQTQSGRPASTPQIATAPAPNASALYRTGIVPIEGGTDRNGNFRTSPKGAIGPGQVMPETAPEAARLAGLPFNDHLYRTDAEYNNKLGEAYYAAKLEEFGGDPIKAAAAYNAGAGRVRRAIRMSQQSGKDWTAHVPPETRKYVQNFTAKIGAIPGGSEASQPSAPSQAQVPVPDIPAAPVEPTRPELADRVRSTRLQIVQNLLGMEGDRYNATQIRAALTPFLDKGLDEDQASKIQYDENRAQLLNNEFTSQRQLYNQNANTAFNQPYKERDAAMGENWKREDTATEHGYKLTEQAAQDKAALERQEAKGAPGKKPPVGQVNAYLNRRSMGRKLQEILTGINKIPDSVNMGYDKVSEQVLQRYDPNGVSTRAAIAEYTGQLLHELSGATVAPEEAARLLPFLPRPSDTPAALKTKAARLQLEISNMNTDARRLFTNTDGTSYFDALEASPASAPVSATPTGPQADGYKPSKSDQDLVNKYL